MKANGIGAFRIIWVLAVLLSLTQLTFAGTIQYTYDNAGRLIRTDYGANKSIAYTYDSNGNLLQRAVREGETGSLQVTIEPAGARTAGAQWRRTGTTPWFDSGVTEGGLAPGACTVEFKTVTGWTAPANQDATIVAGQVTQATGTYTQVGQTGSLQVTIEPEGARTAGAQWRRTGTAAWFDSGATETGLAAGATIVEFKAVSGWTAPANQNVNIVAGQVTQTTGTYTQGPTTCTLTVAVSPVAGGSVTGDGINCPGDCTQTYDQNTNVQLTANPGGGMKFLRWEGALTGTTNPANLLMNADKEVGAYFGAVSGNTDTDGVPDTTESGPNGDTPSYDGNGNGIPDYQEPGAASLRSASGGAYVTLAVPTGSGQALNTVQATGNPSPGDAPEDVQFPYGFFRFRLTGLSAGACTTVTLYIPGTTAITTYYKYGPTPDNPIDHWYEFLYNGQTGAQISYAGGQTRIVLHLCDGQLGDNDLTANGQIEEPGGPGVRSAPIPTLSQWGMIFLGLLMLLMGIRSLRRKGYGPSATA